jgi:hypothetical protein
MPGLASAVLALVSRSLPAATDQNPPATGKQIANAQRLRAFGAPAVEAVEPAGPRRG